MTRLRPQEQRVWDSHFKHGIAIERLNQAQTPRECKEADAAEHYWGTKAAKIFEKEFKSLYGDSERQECLQQVADNALQAGQESVRNKARNR